MSSVYVVVVVVLLGFVLFVIPDSYLLFITVFSICLVFLVDLADLKFNVSPVNFSPCHSVSRRHLKLSSNLVSSSCPKVYNF